MARRLGQHGPECPQDDLGEVGSTGLSALKMIWATHTALQHEPTVGKTLPLRQIVRDNEHRASLIDEFTGESMDE